MDKIDEIFNLYLKYGNSDYIGENVSQLEHALQCARHAELSKFDDSVILGSFFHDIGHLLGESKNLDHMIACDIDYGTINHEKIGADYLRSLGVPEKICYIVQNHVSAKRYLVHKDPLYYERLSDASKQTLEFQGGPMSKEEALNFENNEMFQVILNLRKWDDLAKDTNLNLSSKSNEILNNYKLMLKSLV